jgi:hypothetical protein
VIETHMGQDWRLDGLPVLEMTTACANVITWSTS